MATGDEGDAETLPPTPSSTPSSTQAASKASPGRPPPRGGDDALLRSGDTVARYRIEGLLGRGGMGVVYRARDPDLDRVLAIKLVRSRHRGGDRMLREAQAMARLDHPNVAPVFDVGMRGEQVFLVMPFLAGGTLGDWCRKRARPWRDVVVRYLAAGRGLEAAHKDGIVHRDFKPENVMIGKKGEVQVVDFGLARADADSADDDVAPHGGQLAVQLTRAGDLLGTPAYMAPEQLDGKVVDARADQFSFCVSLHEGLYGVRPFEMPAGGGLAALRDSLRTPVRPPAPGRAVPRWLRDALVRGLRLDPGERWPSMTALLAELERGLRRRMPALAGRTGVVIGAGVAIAALAGGAIWFVSSRDRGRSGAAAPRSGTGSPDVATDTGAPFTPRQLTFRGDLGLSALSPDGTQVAAIAGDDLVLVSTAVDGALRTLLPAAGEVVTLSWSADGRRLLLTSTVDVERSLLRIVDVATGAVERLERAAWREATFSGPREVASITGTARTVRITPLDEDVPSTRCPVPGEYEFLRDITAAGGALFVGLLHRDQTMSLVRTDRSCTAPRLVLDHVPDRGVVVDADGSHAGQLVGTNRGRVLERHPIEGGATVRSRIVPSDVNEIVGRMPDDRLLGLTSRSAWRLERLGTSTPMAVGSSDTQLRLSPDRTQVALVDSRGDEDRALRVVPLASLEARPAPLATGVVGASWSPDGARLAVALARGEHVELVVIELATATRTALPVTDASQYSDPTWLDNQRVAYLRADHTTFAWIDRESRQVGITFDPSLGWTFGLAVSPADGTLAVHWEQQTRNGVFLVPPGGQPTLVAPGGVAINLAWAPDGQALWIYDAKRGVVDRHDRTTGKTERVHQVALDRHTFLGELTPLADGGALMQITSSTQDLVVLE